MFLMCVLYNSLSVLQRVFVNILRVWKLRNDLSTEVRSDPDIHSTEPCSIHLPRSKILASKYRSKLTAQMDPLLESPGTY